MAQSNLAVLTKSHNIIASKKRARREQIKEIVFDVTARREYLTGFHKRNVQKRETAKKKAVEREKQERLETRREHRQMLAERAVQNAKEVEKAYGAEMSDGDDDGDWDGLASSSSHRKGKGKDMGHEEEYEDEEQVATVTVVEEFDPSALLHSTPSQRAPGVGAEEDNGSRPEAKELHASRSLKKTPTEGKKAHAKTSTKAKTIKYQTNSARKVERAKQQKRKTEKAERAGGKPSRKGGKGRGKR